MHLGNLGIKRNHQNALNQTVASPLPLLSSPAPLSGPPCRYQVGPLLPLEVP